MIIPQGCRGAGRIRVSSGCADTGRRDLIVTTGQGSIFVMVNDETAFLRALTERGWVSYCGYFGGRV